MTIICDCYFNGSKIKTDLDNVHRNQFHSRFSNLNVFDVKRSIIQKKDNVTLYRVYDCITIGNDNNNNIYV